MSIGQKIAMLRVESGLSQKELAQMLSISTGKVAEWESDETSPTINEISQICLLFKIPSDYLIIEDKSIAEHTEKIACDTRKKRNKLAALVTLCCLGVLMGIVIILYVFIPNYKYNNAEKLIAIQRYVEAYKILGDIGNKKSLAKMKKIKSKVDQEIIIRSNVRDAVLFGAYEQDNNKKNGKEAIEWIVLAKEKDRTLLVSLKCIDIKKYSPRFLAPTTWETSVAREWLNNDFLKKAFNGNEQEILELTKVKNDDNEVWGTSGGNDTLDKIFLLSYEEVNKYFLSVKDRICKPTEYALESSPWSDGDSEWWLRTAGKDATCHTYIDCEGQYHDNYCAGGHKLYIRPAVWISHNL